nr:hypothetical protein [Tanacetum cinerariifolium]
IEPLYHQAPAAAQLDAQLYALLALTDALRLGRPREVKLARQLLEQQMASPTLSAQAHA